ERGRQLLQPDEIGRLDVVIEHERDRCSVGRLERPEALDELRLRIAAFTRRKVRARRGKGEVLQERCEVQDLAAALAAERRVQAQVAEQGDGVGEVGLEGREL